MFMTGIFTVTLVRKNHKDAPYRTTTWLFSEVDHAKRFVKRFCEGLLSPYEAEVLEDYADYKFGTIYPITKNGFFIGYLEIFMASLDDCPTIEHEDYSALGLLGNLPDDVYDDEEGGE